MRPSFRLIAFMLLLVSCKQGTREPDAAALAKLETAEREMFAAIGNADSTAFRKLAGPDYFTINADGKSNDLETTLRGLDFFKGSTAELSEQMQRVYGILALRTGRAKFFVSGQQVAEVLYTTGWVYRDDQWQFIHWQGTPTGMMLPPTPPAADSTGQ
ncbi:MAG: nuclear transport factor 2 family protein [Chitinophagaceae bacterium]